MKLSALALAATLAMTSPATGKEKPQTIGFTTEETEILQSLMEGGCGKIPANADMKKVFEYVNDLRKKGKEAQAALFLREIQSLQDTRDTSDASLSTQEKVQQACEDLKWGIAQKIALTCRQKTGYLEYPGGYECDANTCPDDDRSFILGNAGGLNETSTQNIINAAIAGTRYEKPARQVLQDPSQMEELQCTEKTSAEECARNMNIAMSIRDTNNSTKMREDRRDQYIDCQLGMVEKQYSPKVIQEKIQQMLTRVIRGKK